MNKSKPVSHSKQEASVVFLCQTITVLSVEPEINSYSSSESEKNKKGDVRIQDHVYWVYCKMEEYFWDLEFDQNIVRDSVEGKIS